MKEETPSVLCGSSATYDDANKFVTLTDSAGQQHRLPYEDVRRIKFVIQKRADVANRRKREDARRLIEDVEVFGLPPTPAYEMVVKKMKDEEDEEEKKCVDDDDEDEDDISIISRVLNNI